MLGVFATALFYGNSMITPAISVLSAVEGLTTVNAGLRAVRHADRDRDPGRPVRDPVARDGPGRADVRPGDDDLFRDDRGARASCTSSTDPAVILAMLNPLNAVHFFTARLHARLHRAGLGRPGRDRRRGALRRHGPFRAQADPGLLALLRPAGAAAQLYGAGRDDPFGRRRTRRSPRSRTRSSTSRPTACGCRWSCSRPRRRSSPARR